MKYMKRALSLLTALLLCFFCFACSSQAPQSGAPESEQPAASSSPSEPEPSSEVEEKEDEATGSLITEKHFTDDSDENIKFDADINIHENALRGTLRYPEQMLINIDPKAVAEVFSDLLQTQDYQESVEDYTDYVMHIYNYTTKDPSLTLSLTDNMSGLTLFSKYDDDLSRVFIYNSGDPNYNQSNFPQKDLSFESRASVGECIKGMAERLGLEVCDDYEIISLDKETLAQRQSAIEAIEGPTGVTSQWQDTYFVYFRLACDGVPVLDTIYNSESLGFAVPPSFLYAVVTEDGIKLFDAEGFTGKAGDESTAQLIPLEDAVAALKQAYADVILDEPLNIENISMYYSLHNQKLTPCYSFEYYPPESKATEKILIDAVTGEKI